MFVFTGYGVQKNVSNGAGVISSGVSTGKSGTVLFSSNLLKSC